MPKQAMSRRSVPPPSNLLAGIVRLTFFNSTGFAAVGNTRQAFLSSLAPLVAFMLVGSTLQALGGGWRGGLRDLLQTSCLLLAQPVTSHLLARAWKREDRWLRYATAMNWCQLSFPAVSFGFALLALFAGAVGPSPRTLAFAVLGALCAYALLLNWFLARRGLDLGAWRAAAFVLVVTGALVLVLLVPIALRLALAMPAAPHINT